MTDERKYFSPTAADELTKEIIDAAYEIADGWYQNTRIDWEDLLERLERAPLESGDFLDMGSDMLSPAIKRLRSEVNKMRRES